MKDNGKEIRLKESRDFWFYVSIALSFVLMTTGIAGIMPGFKSWIEALQIIFEVYLQLRAYVLSFIPLKLPAWTFDYLVVGSGFSISSRAIRRQRRFIELGDRRLPMPEAGLWKDRRQPNWKQYGSAFVDTTRFPIIAFLFWPAVLIALPYYIIQRERPLNTTERAIIASVIREDYTLWAEREDFQGDLPEFIKKVRQAVADETKNFPRSDRYVKLTNVYSIRSHAHQYAKLVGATFLVSATVLFLIVDFGRTFGS